MTRKLFGRREDRSAFVQRVRDVVSEFGWRVELVFGYTGIRITDITVTLSAERSGHAVFFTVKADPSLLLHWYTRDKSSRYPDPFITGSLVGATGVNQHHFAKATSYCDTPDVLIDTLREGIRVLEAQHG